MYIDLHCHKREVKADTLSIINVEISKDILKNKASSIFNNDLHFKESYISLGIHPWQTSAWEDEDILMYKSLFENKNVLFVGETGYDKYCDVQKEKQIEVFNSQLAIADSLRKPVLLHNVGGMEIILKAKNNYKSIPAWILHGFRGNLQELRQFSAKNFYFTFGEKFNAEALKACDETRLFIETDVSEKSIEEIYRLVAETRSVSMNELVSQVEVNFNNLRLTI
jgi:TatD DNase family protein